MKKFRSLEKLVFNTCYNLKNQHQMFIKSKVKHILNV